jgi:hypothetical protein
MTDLLIITAALLVVAIASELVLGRAKVQTGLLRIMAAWAAVYFILLYFFLGWTDVDAVAFTIFWGGAFLSWFGVRSHIESSILLRMTYLLRRGPLTDAELVANYNCQFSEEMRLEELLRGGLLVRDEGHLVVTPKGKIILAMVDKIR